MTEEKCNDKKCWKHGSVKVRGGKAVGTITSTKSRNTVSVRRDTIKFIPKYRRWARIKSTISAHNPSCIAAKVGDMVKISETRKLSKTKAWTVVEIIGEKK